MNTYPAYGEPPQGKLTLRRMIRINSSGYDDSGAYWGRGMPLYWCGSDDGRLDMHLRAHSRDNAKEQVRARLQPFTCTFHK